MPRFSRTRDIRVGVIGYGGAYGMGHQHLERAEKVGMTPVAVADPDTKRLEVAARDFPRIECFPSVSELLRRSDANLLVVVTPHNTHAKLAIQCLRAGRHVITEKPFAITTAECDRMIEVAKKQRRMLSSYHNRHWDGGILGALKVVRRGSIGQVVGVDLCNGQYDRPRDWWRSSKSISGGILYDWGVHMLEWGLQLIDSQISEVSGFAASGFWAPQTRWKEDTIEDEARAVVRFRSGQWINLRISHIEPKRDKQGFTVTGTRGTYIAGEGVIRCKGDRTLTTPVNAPRQWERYYRNIVNHLTRAEPLIITPQWARRPIHILDLAARSARLGRALRAKYG